RFRRGREIAVGTGDVLTEIRCVVYQAVALRRLGDVEAVRALDIELDDFDDAYGYEGLISANRAWVALRDGDLDAVERWSSAAIASWPEDKRAGPTVFQWSARFPLLAADVARGRSQDAAVQARAM